MFHDWLLISNNVVSCSMNGFIMSSNVTWSVTDILSKHLVGTQIRIIVNFEIMWVSLHHGEVNSIW